MNWDRGLKRITFILSIIGAIIGAGLFFYKAKTNLSYWEKRLREDRLEKYGDLNERQWIDYWNDPVVPGHINESLVERQRRTLESWMKEKPRPIFIIPDELNATEAEQYKAMLIKQREEKLESLKEQGWQTTNGEAMPITPEEVWNIYHQSSIATSEMGVDFCLSRIPIETTKGALLGLCTVWIVHGVIIGLVWPVVIWITHGFREEKQKDEQKRNESGTVGDC